MKKGGLMTPSFFISLPLQVVLDVGDFVFEFVYE